MPEGRHFHAEPITTTYGTVTAYLARTFRHAARNYLPRQGGHAEAAFTLFRYIIGDTGHFRRPAIRPRRHSSRRHRLFVPLFHYADAAADYYFTCRFHNVAIFIYADKMARDACLRASHDRFRPFRDVPRHDTIMMPTFLAARPCRKYSRPFVQAIGPIPTSRPPPPPTSALFHQAPRCDADDVLGRLIFAARAICCAI